MKKILSLLAALTFLLLPLEAFATPTIADTLNVTNRVSTTGSSDSFTYTVPAGTNQVLIVIIEYSSGTFSATQNGTSLTMVQNNTAGQCDGTFAVNSEFAYLVAPTSGTFTLTKGGVIGTQYTIFTVNGADQSANPIDAYYCKGHASGGSATSNVSTTTPSANDLLVDESSEGSNLSPSSHGAGQTEYVQNLANATYQNQYGSYVNGSSTTNTLQGMSETWASGTYNGNLQMIAIKAAAAAAAPVWDSGIW